MPLFGGDSWTRTNDPIDVNDVLCLGGKVCRKQMSGVHMPKNVDITGFSQITYNKLRKFRIL